MAAAGEDFAGFPSACGRRPCRMVIDRRFLIEEDIADVKDEIAQHPRTLAARRERLRYELRDFGT